MNSTLFTVNNTLNVNQAKETVAKDDLIYFFIDQKSSDSEKICFSVFLKNNSSSIINQIWFFAFIGIGGTGFAPGLSEQDSFYFKKLDLAGALYLSGYTKESFKLPPETPLEIFYFEIPKDKLSNEGSLEFYFGSELIKKISFTASWEKGEIEEKLREVSPQNFINFLKYKNQKTYFESVVLFIKRSFKKLKSFFKRKKNRFKKDTNF